MATPLIAFSERKTTCSIRLFIFLAVCSVLLMVLLSTLITSLSSSLRNGIQWNLTVLASNTSSSSELGERNNRSLKFAHVLTGTVLEIQLEIVDAFHAAMKRIRIPYFMCYGTLLGSWRHHGMIPWDDDVDVAVPVNRKNDARQALDELRPRYYLTPHAGDTKWKFYSNRSREVRNRNWAWPYIDIVFYSSNATHMWEKEITTLNYEDVFPLHDRPFMNRMLPAPVNTEAMLSKMYDLGTCSIGLYDHKNEQYKPQTETYSMPCKELETMYAIVHQNKLGNSTCNETLVLNSQVIGWFFRDFGTC